MFGGWGMGGGFACGGTITFGGLTYGTGGWAGRQMLV